MRFWYVCVYGKLKEVNAWSEEEKIAKKKKLQLGLTNLVDFIFCSSSWRG